MRSPLKGLNERLRQFSHFNGLRKASPEFHSRAGHHRSEEAGARSHLSYLADFAPSLFGLRSEPIMIFLREVMNL